jgi:pheromone shutdown protein TraB
VRADAGVVSQSEPPPVTFLHPSEFGISKTVTSNTLSLAGLTNLTVSDTTVLNADLGPVTAVLGAAAVAPLNVAFTALDTGLITPLVHALGLGIGGADLTALSNSLVCDGLRLVQ